MDLDLSLRKQIADHNEKVEAFQKEIFALKQELSLKVETNSFLKNNLEILKQESSEGEDKYIDEVLVLNKKKKELENITRYDSDVKPLVSKLRDTLPKFVQELHKEVFEMKQIFKGMETDVNACFVEKKDVEIEKQQLLIKNDRLLEESMSCDIMCIILHSVKEFDASSDLSCIFIDNCAKYESIETKLFNQRENVDNKSFKELSKRFTKLEEYSISLELCLQHYKEKIICNESWKKHDASLIIEFNNKSNEINEMKAQLQEKAIIVNELKNLLTKLKGKGVDTQFEA
ncbi:hypothetical protein Tco_0896442 [Tanacetum coccineum]